MRRHRNHGAPLLALTLLVSLTGCAITETGPTPAGLPATGSPQTGSEPAAAVHVYFYAARGLERVSRPYRGPDAANAALRRLAEGPNAAESARGLVSYAPRNSPAPLVANERHNPLDLYVPPGWNTRTVRRQLVCTAADAASGQQDAKLPEIRVRVHHTSVGNTTTHTCVP